MRQLPAVIMLIVLSGRVWCGEIVLQSARGEVTVRSGATVQWVPLRKGTLLKPSDTMRTGAKGSAVLLVKDGGGKTGKRVTIPSNVILDLSDIRTLTQEELLLSITMDRVRQSPPEQQNDQEMKLPNATVVHGERHSDTDEMAEDTQVKAMRVNGTRVLFDNRYYSTCVLRTLDLMRWFPSLKESFDRRLMLAESLEKSNLNGEALVEYLDMASMEALTPQQHALLQDRIARLKRDS